MLGQANLASEASASHSFLKPVDPIVQLLGEAVGASDKDRTEFGGGIIHACFSGGKQKTDCLVHVGAITAPEQEAGQIKFRHVRAKVGGLAKRRDSTVNIDPARVAFEPRQPDSVVDSRVVGLPR